MRKSSVGDRSFIPSRVKRDSSGNAPRPFGSVPRKPLGAGIPVLKRGSAFGSTGFANQNRNSSGYGNTANRWSFSSSTGRPSYTDSAFKKDTRPNTDKEFVSKCIRKLLEFLTQENYPVNVTTRMLQVPQTKDFTKIFEFLYRYLDPYFVMPVKFEEEIPKYLKVIGYPCTISKSQLLAVGTKHGWPFLIGALNWMREFIEYRRMLADEPMQCFGQTENEFFLDYSVTAYDSFLSGNDDLTPIQELMEVKINSISDDELYGLDIDSEEFMKELTILRGNQGKLDSVKREEIERRQDLVKYEEYLQQLETHVEFKRKEVLAIKEEIEARESDLAEIREANKKLQHQVENQAVTLTDVEDFQNKCLESEGIKAKFERQEKNIDTLIWDEEIKFSNIKGKLEAIAEECNNISRQCQLIPSNAANAQGKNFEIYPTFKSTSVADLMSKKMLLSQIQKESNIKINEMETRKHSLEVNYSKLEELLKSKEDEIKQIENRIHSHDNDLDFKKTIISKEFEAGQEIVETKQSKIKEIRHTGQDLCSLEQECSHLALKLKERQEAETIKEQQRKEEFLQNVKVLFERKKELEVTVTRIKNTLNQSLNAINYG